MTLLISSKLAMIREFSLCLKIQIIKTEMTVK